MNQEKLLLRRLGLMQAKQRCWERIAYTREEATRQRWERALHLLTTFEAGYRLAIEFLLPTWATVTCEAGSVGRYCGAPAGQFRWAADPPKRSKACCLHCALASLFVVGGGVIESRQPDGSWKRLGGSTISMVLGGPAPRET